MTTLSSTNLGPSITSLGVGSGLDAQGIVDKLIAVESRPISILQNQQDDLYSNKPHYR